MGKIREDRAMRWTLLFLGLIVSGCFTLNSAKHQGPPPRQSTTPAQVDAMVGVQKPADYKSGFRDGCNSGNVEKGNNSYNFKKDETRFDSDAQYRQGWSDGFTRCIDGVTLDDYSGQSYSASSNRSRGSGGGGSGGTGRCGARRP